MGILAVLLHEENLYFSKEHLDDIYEKTSLMSHRGKRNHFYYDNQIALSCQSDIPLASQPFQFHNDRYTLVYDGCIYNIVEIRKKLMKAGFTFETNMETEVIAKLFLHKKQHSFDMLRGSFAILIWDQKTKTFYGARDRFGIKPLYYMKSDEETIFASEKKSTLFACYEEKIDDYAFHQYLDYQYVPEPYTMTKGIRKVKPGHYFIKKINKPISFHRFFYATFQPQKVKQANLTETVSKALFEAVDAQITHTEANGLFLRNNAYSATLALFAKQIDPNVKTFSVHFNKNDKRIDEIVKFTETEHISMNVTAEQFIASLPKIVWLLDNPFANLSIVTNYFTAHLAREHVTSIILDEGAEGVFGSLNRKHKRESIITRIPKAIHRFTSFLPNMKKTNSSSHSAHHIEDLFTRQFTTREKRQLLKRIITEDPIQKKLFDNVKEEDEIIQRQYIHLHSELPSNRLSQIEKLTTASGLKLHLPFLDHKLFSVIRTIPVEQKEYNQIANHILQTVFSKKPISTFVNHTPNEVVAPIHQWLRNECYDWARQLIKESKTDYLIDKAMVLNMLNRYLQNEAMNVDQLWTILIFMVWHEVYVENKYAFRDQTATEEVLAEVNM